MYQNRKINRKNVLGALRKHSSRKSIMQSSPFIFGLHCFPEAYRPPLLLHSDKVFSKYAYSRAFLKTFNEIFLIEDHPI